MRGGQWQALRLIEGLAAEGRGIDAVGVRRVAAVRCRAARADGASSQSISCGRWLARGRTTFYTRTTPVDMHSAYSRPGGR